MGIKCTKRLWTTNHEDIDLTLFEPKLVFCQIYVSTKSVVNSTENVGEAVTTLDLALRIRRGCLFYLYEQYEDGILTDGLDNTCFFPETTPELWLRSSVLRYTIILSNQPSDLCIVQVTKDRITGIFIRSLEIASCDASITVWRYGECTIYFIFWSSFLFCVIYLNEQILFSNLSFDNTFSKKTAAVSYYFVASLAVAHATASLKTLYPSKFSFHGHSRKMQHFLVEIKMYLWIVSIERTFLEKNIGNKIPTRNFVLARLTPSPLTDAPLEFGCCHSNKKQGEKFPTTCAWSSKHYSCFYNGANSLRGKLPLKKIYIQEFFVLLFLRKGQFFENGNETSVVLLF